MARDLSADGTEPPAAGRVLWYRCDDEATDGIADTSGGGRDATCFGGAACPRLVAGRLGGALAFDGADQARRLNVAGELTTPSGYTFAAYFNASVWDGTLVELRHAASGAGFLEHAFKIALPDTGRILATYKLAGSVPTQLSASGLPLAAGEWVHVALSWDGATLRLYVNGAATAAIAQAPNTHVPSELLLGCELSATGAAEEHFNGLLDEIVFYDRALAAAEIRQLLAP